MKEKTEKWKEKENERGRESWEQNELACMVNKIN